MKSKILLIPFLLTLMILFISGTKVTHKFGLHSVEYAGQQFMAPYYGPHIDVKTPLDKIRSNRKRRHAYIQRLSRVHMGNFIQGKTACPPSIGICQAILESNAGKTPYLYGIKSRKPAPKDSVWTKEFENGKWITKKAVFHTYPSYWAAIQAHCDFLHQPRYKHLHRTEIAEDWAWGLQEAGYATDPRYANKLLRIRDLYHLDVVDSLARVEKYRDIPWGFNPYEDMGPIPYEEAIPYEEIM